MREGGHDTNIGQRVLKTILGLSLFLFVLWMVDVRKLFDALSHISAEAVVWLVFMSIVLIYVSALKWKLFLEELGGNVSLWRLFRLYIIGYFVNLILPSYLAGDAVRSWYIGKTVGQHEALAATILERYTGLLAMVVLGIGASFVVTFVPWQIRAVMILLALALAAVTLVALSRRAVMVLDHIKILRPLVKHVHKVQEALHLARKNHSLLLKALIFSFLYHLLTVVNTIVAATAVGWLDPSFIQLVIVLPLILIIGALPISPNGLGLQEGAWVFFLQSVGATPAEALGIAIVLRAKSYLIALFGYFFWMGEKTRMDAQSET